MPHMVRQQSVEHESAVAFLGGGEPSAEVVDMVTEWWRVAQATWPGMAYDPVAFFALVGKAAKHQLEAAAKLRLPDLLLARASLARDPVALKHLDSTVLPRARVVIERVGDGDFQNEVVQHTRQRLILAEGKSAPKLESYSGSGTLLNWVRSVMYRTAMTLKRSSNDVAPDAQTLASLPDSGWSAELQFIKAAHREAFGKVFSEALAALDENERTLLRLNLVENLSIDRLGAIYQTHRSTAARWVGEAKRRLTVEVEKRLRDRLQLTRAEYDGLMLSLQDNLQVSLIRLMNEE